jgi:hypothetical protein
MKSRVFVLTKNEQRVIALAVVLLLIGAFVRYSRDLKSMPATSKPVETSTPLGSTQLPPPELDETIAEDHGEGSSISSPQPSP